MCNVHIGRLPSREMRDEQAGRSNFGRVRYLLCRGFIGTVGWLVMMMGCLFANGTLLLMVANISPAGNPANMSYNCPRVLVDQSATFATTWISENVEKSGWSWCVFIAFSIREISCFVVSFLRCISERKKRAPAPHYFYLVFLMEILHVLGASILLFYVFPQLNSILCAMILSMMVGVPLFVNGLFSFPNNRDQPENPAQDETTSLNDETSTAAVRIQQSFMRSRCYSIALILAFILQIFNAYLLLEADLVPHSFTMKFLATIGCFLTSCCYWENFLRGTIRPDNWDSSNDERASDNISLRERLYRLHKKNVDNRHQIIKYLAPVKVIFMGLLMVAFSQMRNPSQNLASFGQGLLALFSTVTNESPTNHEVFPDLTRTSWNNHSSSECVIPIDSARISHFHYWMALTLQVWSVWVVSRVATIACQILMQRWMFSLPLILSSPLLVLVIGFLAEYDFLGTSPLHIKFRKPYDGISFWNAPLILCYLTGLVLQIAATWHVWARDHVRTVILENPESLFLLLPSNGLAIDLHLLLSRKRIGKHVLREDENMAKIYACATLWRETKQEMKSLIDSLLRLDERDHHIDLGYQYNLECHVYFDDAFWKRIHNKHHEKYHEIRKQFLYTNKVKRLNRAALKPVPESGQTTMDNNINRNTCNCKVFNRDEVTSETELDSPIPENTRSYNRFADAIGTSLSDFPLPVEQSADQMEGSGLCSSHKKADVDRLNDKVRDFCWLLYNELETRRSSKSLPEIREIAVPYGACYLWKLTHGTHLYLHLKDKLLVKAGKRWSQLMCFHDVRNMLNFPMNLCGLEKDSMLTEEDKNKRRLKAKNTFILALDGDMEFKAKSVKNLLQYIKKEPTVAAVCSYIEPTGGGPLAWIQNFEYATSQWLQKVTEQMFGSIMCAPGCFSLYRVESLMYLSDEKTQTSYEEAIDFVIGNYSRKAENAMERLKYDQGEDRWLCTLMLKAGYGVHYCALSNAKTRVPESFFEFFNQRRRWISSSTANLIEILNKSSSLSDNNDHLSYVYIVYPLLQFISTLLSPGMTVLMLAQSAKLAFCLPLPVAVLIAVMPSLIFAGFCWFTSERTQINFARFLGFVYALLMLINLIGLLKGLAMDPDGVHSPSFIVALFIGGVFVFTAILHPKHISFLLIFHGIVFFLSIPTMYVLLPVYTLCGLNNVKWGTREKTEPGSDRTCNAKPNVSRNTDQNLSCCVGNNLEIFNCCTSYHQDEVLSSRIIPSRTEITGQNDGPAWTTQQRSPPDNPEVIIPKTFCHPKGAVSQVEINVHPAGEDSDYVQQPLPKASSASAIPQSEQNSSYFLHPFSLQKMARHLKKTSMHSSQTSIFANTQRFKLRTIDEILKQAVLWRYPSVSGGTTEMWKSLLVGKLNPQTGRQRDYNKNMAVKMDDLRKLTGLIFFAVNVLLLITVCMLLQDSEDLTISLPRLSSNGKNLPVPINVERSSDLRQRGVNLLEMHDDSSKSIITAIFPKPSHQLMEPPLTCAASQESFIYYNSTTQMIRVDPVGSLFLALFVFVLVVQVLCMLSHRLLTFTHFLAETMVPVT